MEILNLLDSAGDALSPYLREALRTVVDSAEYPAFDRLVRTDGYRSYYAVHGVHGVGHIHRVLFLCALLHERLARPPGEDGDARALLLAAAYHDACRVRDVDEAEHALRAEALLYRVKAGSSQAVLAEAGFAIRCHAMGGHEFEIQAGAQENPRLVRTARILRDADALDRVRFFSELGIAPERGCKRFIDLSRLHFAQSRELLSIAAGLAAISDRGGYKSKLISYTTGSDLTDEKGCYD